MTDDQLTRALAVLVRLAKMVSDYDMAREQYDTYGDDPIEERDLGEWTRDLRDDLRDPLLAAAPALLALAEAAVRLVAAHRWPDGGGEHYIQCVGCGGHAWRPTMIAHATDCPAVAVDAALAALAGAGDDEREG